MLTGTETATERVVVQEAVPPAWPTTDAAAAAQAACVGKVRLYCAPAGRAHRHRIAAARFMAQLLGLSSSPLTASTFTPVLSRRTRSSCVARSTLSVLSTT